MRIFRKRKHRKFSRDFEYKWNDPLHFKDDDDVGTGEQTMLPLVKRELTSYLGVGGSKRNQFQPPFAQTPFASHAPIFKYTFFFVDYKFKFFRKYCDIIIIKKRMSFYYIKAQLAIKYLYYAYYSFKSIE